jgi:hypothetical protein
MYAYSRTVYNMPILNIIPITVIGPVELGSGMIVDDTMYYVVNEELTAKLSQEFKELMH